MHAEALVCPETGQRLTELDLAEAEARSGGPLAPLRLPGKTAAGHDAPAPVGATPRVLLREDLRRAYPIADGVPVLLVPEALGRPEERRAFDLTDPRFAEAYDEMEFYNAESARESENIESSEALAILAPVMRAPAGERASFPEPRRVWLDAVYDSASQYDAYRHMAPVAGKRVLQLGGKGIHAVKFLLAGAAEAWTVSPMLGEALCARALARKAGVEDRLHAVMAVAEQLPFPPGFFDGIYSGGCVHHMVTDLAFPEAARVLRPGGRFAAIEPWRAPLYTIGTRIFGKREANAYCRPLTPERVAPLRGAFPRWSLERHGALTRYSLLALNKLGVPLTLGAVWSINRVDDAIASRVPGLRDMGSSVAILGSV
ncbi:MAG: methyltransferase domain-containing protein [Longimicrobiaceae bacterium]